MVLGDFIKVLCARVQEAHAALGRNHIIIGLGSFLSQETLRDDVTLLMEFTLWYTQNQMSNPPQFDVITDAFEDGTEIIDLLFPFEGVAVEKYATLKFIDAFNQTIASNAIWDSRNRAVCIRICNLIEQNPQTFMYLNFDHISIRLKELKDIDSTALTSIRQSLERMLKAVQEAQPKSIVGSGSFDAWIYAHNEKLTQHINNPAEIKKLIQECSHTFNIHELVHDIMELTKEPTQQCQLFFIIVGFGHFDEHNLTGLPEFITEKTIKTTVENSAMQEIEAIYTDGVRAHVLQIKQDEKFVFTRMLAKLALPLAEKREIFKCFVGNAGAYHTALLAAVEAKSGFRKDRFCQFFSISFDASSSSPNEYRMDEIFLSPNVYTFVAYHEIKRLSDALPLLTLTAGQIVKLHEIKGNIYDALVTIFNDKFTAPRADFADKIESLFLLADALATDEAGTPANPLSQIICNSRGPLALTKAKVEYALKTAVEKLYNEESEKFTAWVRGHHGGERVKLVYEYYTQTTTAKRGNMLTRLWNSDSSSDASGSSTHRGNTPI